MSAFSDRLFTRERWRAVPRAMSIALLGAWLTACGGSDDSQVNFNDPALEARLDAAFKQWATEQGLDGAAIKLKRDDFEWSSATGLEQRDKSTAYSLQTQQRVGSVTKPMTTVVILQLIEEGLLRLDTPLSDFFDYPNGEQITVEHLLRHRSGIYDISLDDKNYPTFILANVNRWLTADEVLKLTVPGDTFPSNKPIDSREQGKEIPRGPANAPGDAYHYSQPGFVALGKMIQVVTGKSVQQVYRERIFTRLGMTNTYIPSENGPNFPVSYTNLFGSLPAKLPSNALLSSLNAYVSSSLTAGGVVSTAEDIMKFHMALESGELLSPSSMALMKSFIRADPEDATGRYDYGLGYSHQYRAGGYTIRGHNGSLPGSGATMQFYEDFGLYISGTRNSDLSIEKPGYPDLIERIRRALVNEPQ